MAQPVPLEVKHNWTAQMWDWPLQHHDGVARLHNDAKGFEVSLELQAFTPKEITVQVIGRNVIIDCLHEERSDKHGSIKREVSAQARARRFTAAGASFVCAARRR